MKVSKVSKHSRHVHIIRVSKAEVRPIPFDERVDSRILSSVDSWLSSIPSIKEQKVKAKPKKVIKQPSAATKSNQSEDSFPRKWILPVVTILGVLTVCSIVGIVLELLLTSKDWIIEQVKLIPIDDGQLKYGNKHKSYMVYRQSSYENLTSFILDLKLNENFNSYIPIEYDNDENKTKITNCLFYTGSVRHWGELNSMVAISICSSLAGLIHHTQNGIDYFLEPIVNENEQSYILTYQQKFLSNQNHIWSCEMNSSNTANQTYKHNRIRRSVIRERFIETLLVADASVSEFFSHSHITELYLLTMMNMVHSIYAHVSLGYPVEIVLTRIIILTNESDFQMASRSHETLHKFCEWQEQIKKTNKKNRTTHHDVGVFLTRKSLCHQNSSCSTIGLANMAGMCMVNRSCNINQDVGLISAFTIAHEIGHNLGMSHDNDKGHCTSNSGLSNSDTIMVPSYSKVPINMWSQCSRDNLTDFFDQGWAKCLNNKPTIIQSFDDILPGIIFDLDEQCRLDMGPHSTYCFLGDEPPIDVCNQMMCTKMHEGRSICLPSMANQPADGTLCGQNKWCLLGRCTPMNYRSETLPINGGWSPWTPWSSCSHTCGLGVEYQQRTCTNPKPDFNGKHCLGVRKRYRTCTIAPCKKLNINYKHESHLNCDELNSKSNGTKWKTVPWFASVPCMVFCTPIISSVSLDNDTTINSNITLTDDAVGKVESIKFRDGTQCRIDNDNDNDNENFIKHNGICIAGQCQKLGCDNQLYSTAIEDECGICNGNRSYCQQITKIFQYKKNETTPAGSYVKIGSISKGIATFQIEKTTQSSSFLAIQVKGRFYLNGNRSITEQNSFQIGQTRMWYKRGIKQEILEGRGHPLTEHIDIMLLIQNNDLIKVKCMYWELINETIINKTRLVNNYYTWSFENQTNDDCSCTIRQPYCTFKSHQNEIIVVSDQLCDSKTKPRPLKCQNTNCPIQVPSAPRWQVGPWRSCEGRCWPQEAIQRRSLLCVRTISNNRTHTIPTSICTHRLSSVPIIIRECPQNMSSTIPRCSKMKIYSQWNASEWIGNCSSSNPCAMQYRNITCVSYDPNAICTADENLKPIDRRPCNTSCGHWLVSHWSDNCTGSCNNATLTRRVWCSSSICNQHERPSSTRRCILSHCTNASIYKTKPNTTSIRPTLNTTLKTTKVQLNTTFLPIRTSKTVNTTQKISLTTKLLASTTHLPKTSPTTKTSTTIHKKISTTISSTTSTRIKLITTTTKATTKTALTTKKINTTIKKKNIIKKP
ncbi:unnamed protein product [Rotaria sp. Silwood1]|nr:unnamed protein product [Rotaria sp. Silwood1]